MLIMKINILLLEKFTAMTASAVLMFTISAYVC